MNDRDLQVLEQYPFTVRGSFRVRGAFLLDTSEGRRLIREYSGSVQKLETEQKLLLHLQEQGYLVDRMEPDQEGKLVSVWREYNSYVVKEALEGRECDTRSESEIMKAASLLGSLHLSMRNCMELSEEEYVRMIGSDAEDELCRHNRELKKIDRFIRKKTRKNEFETAYLSCFPKILEEAEWMEQMLERSAYKKLRQRALEEGHFCHGEYTHHNILVNGSRMAVINFEKCSINVQINDLYHFMRKILEKQNYDFRLGIRMLRAYEEKNPLSPEEREYLGIRMEYPEKFWKLANYYYNTNKAWIPGKHMEKLEKFLGQQEKRVSFSRELLYNNSNQPRKSGR